MKKNHKKHKKSTITWIVLFRVAEGHTNVFKAGVQESLLVRLGGPFKGA